MTTTIRGLFDGHVLRLEEPLALPPNTRVLITVATESAEQTNTRSFLEIAESLNLSGPADWSERVDDYLYGSGADRNG